MANRVSTELATRSLVFFAAVIFTCAISGQTRSKSTPTPTPRKTDAAVLQPSPQAAPPTSPDVPLIGTPQIADEAMQLKQRLRGLPDRLTPEALLAETEQAVSGLRETIGEKSRETAAVIQSGATFADLQQLSLDWQSLTRQVAHLAQTLAKQATAVEAEARSLRDDQVRWDQTYNQIKAADSPPELVDLTTNALDDIRNAVKLADEQRVRIVALQQAVAAQGTIASGEIENVRKAIAESQRSLLEQDSPPIWRAQVRSQTDETLERLLRKSYGNDLTRLKNFLILKRRALFGIALITLAALALFVRLRQRTKTIREVPTGSADPGEVFDRPVSLALLVCTVAMLPLFNEAPIGTRGLVDLLAVIPVVRLLMPGLKTPFRRMMAALIASVLVWHLIKVLQLQVWIKRDLLAVFSIAVIALFYWLVRSARRDGANLQRGQALAIVAVHAGLLLMVVSFLSNIFGYIGLSDLIGNGALLSAYRATALYTVFVVGTKIISFTLQKVTAQGLVIIRNRTSSIARRLSFALALTMFLAWVHSSLNLFAVRDDVYRAVKTSLNYQITIGTASFAPGNIVVFVLTLFFGYLIASITRAILGEAILPRLNLARGLPNAIATITHYLALLLIFLLALSASGVELSQFTVLAGAFGVGLGFGLQNVVNNFVSGLILLVERPVRVGDLLEVGEVNGEVTKIGFRSSTLRSPDGAYVIIPNANLISQQVINWTLSGTRRRVFLLVHVAYGNDPERVRSLLLETAASHPDVLKVPKPTALFLGFGESALEFEVLFWAPRSEIVRELKSDVTLKVATALRDAGIEVPLPQRELHLKRMDEKAMEGLAVLEKDEETETTPSVRR